MSRRLLAVAALVLTAAIAIALIAVPSGEKPREPLVVGIELKGATDASDTATGFVVGRGQVVTVAHVLDPGREMLVHVGGQAHRARLLRADRRYDLALIAVPGLGPDAGARRAGGGDRLLVVRRGRTIRLAATLRRRIRATVRGPDWGPYRRPAMELATHAELGDSGAPLVDSHGHVAGVLFARKSDGSRTAYAVDASALDEFLSR